MKEVLKIFFVLFFISLITFSTINVFAEDSGISNLANDTNATNGTNKTVTGNAGIQPMSVTVSLEVSPASVNFGTLMADGDEHNLTGATTAHITAVGLTGNLYVRAGGDFTRGNDVSSTISLNNFQFDCLGVDNGTKRPFTTSNSAIDSYTYLLYYDHTYTINYYLTVPKKTDPGTYNTTIIYTAT